MSRSRRFAWYVVTQWTAALVNAGVAIALIPFLQRELGDDGYGLTVVVLTIANFSLISQFGLRAALGRHMSEQIALGNNEEVNRLFSSAMATFATISIAVTLVLCVFAEPIVHLFKVPPPLVADAVFLVRIFSSGMVALSLLTPAWGSVLFGHSRFDLVDYAAIVDMLLRAAGVLAFLTWTNWGLMGWCAAVLGAKSASCLLTVAFAHWQHAGLRATVRRISRSSLIELISLGSMISLREIANQISQTVEPLMVSAYLGLVGVSFFTPATRLINAPAPFISAIARQFTTMATGRHTTGDAAGVQEILFRGTRLTFSVAALATVLLVAFAHPLVRAFLGPGRDVTAWVLIFGSSAQLMQYTIGSQWQVMMGKNRVRFIAVTQIIAAFAGVAASLALITAAFAWSSADNRMLACSLAVVAPAIVIRVIERVLTARHVAQECDCRPWTYFLQSYFRPLVTLAVCGTAALLIRGSVDLASWPRLIVASALVSALWAALTWWMVFDRVDRDRVLALFRRVRRTSGGEERLTGSEQI